MWSSFTMLWRQMLVFENGDRAFKNRWSWQSQFVLIPPVKFLFCPDRTALIGTILLRPLADHAGNASSELKLSENNLKNRQTHSFWNWLFVPLWSRSWHKQPTINARLSTSLRFRPICPLCNTPTVISNNETWLHLKQNSTFVVKSGCCNNVEMLRTL